MFKKNIFTLLLVILAIISNKTVAQNFTNQHWYFGNNALALEFAKPHDTLHIVDGYKSAPFNRKGNATANNPETGDLLFYTDGTNIYDRAFKRMNGALGTLQADPAKNQSVAISSVPGNNESYYIFTNTNTNGIQLSTVDMTLVGNSILGQPPLGEITSINAPIISSTATPSDAMLIIANSTKTGYWLITLDNNSNNYKVLGINNLDPNNWIETTYTLGVPLIASHLSFHEGTSRIAVAPKSSNIDIQLLTIDLATGLLSFDLALLNSNNADFPTEAIFDVLFSKDGSKLYYSKYGDQANNIADLIQVDLADTIQLPHQSVLPESFFGSYGLQMGTDGNLYHLYQEKANTDPYLLGRLINTDSVANNTTYEVALEDGANFNSLQFPALLPQRELTFTTLDFTYTDSCLLNFTSFFPNIYPAPTFVQWNFGDGATSDNYSPFYMYTSAGLKTVTLTAFLNGQSSTISKTINILDFQTSLSLPLDTIACQCELPIYAPLCETAFSVTVRVQEEQPGTTYKWSNGDVGKTLTPDSAGYYYVVATIGECTAYAGLYVKEYDSTIPAVTPISRRNTWYFGENAGVDFTVGNAITDGAMDALEGCTAVSDKNGDILFYTDGDVIYNKDHTALNTGGALGGTPSPNSAAQSVIAVNVPNSETLFYIFTTQNTSSTSPNYEFSYSVYNLEKDMVSKKSILFSKSTERIASSENWVIIHEYGNNNFRAYPITSTGIGTPVISSIGKEHISTYAENGKGYMKLNRNKLGLAIVENNGTTITNYLDVFDFNELTGEVTNPRRANLTNDGANGKAYGVEISGTKILVSIKNSGNSQIMEYWIDYTNTLVFSGNIANNVIPELGAIQTGPDGRVYVAQKGSNSLGIISVNQDTILNSSYTETLLLDDKRSHLGLPNYTSTSSSHGTNPYDNFPNPWCVNQTIALEARGSSSIDEVEWRIRHIATDKTIYTSNLMNPESFVPDSTYLLGDYDISIFIYNRCIDTVYYRRDTITLNPSPQKSDLPKSAFICGSSIELSTYITPPANSNNLIFLWSTEETSPNITVTLPGSYTVLVTNTVTGCFTSSTIVVAEAIQADLGTDKEICEEAPLILDSKVNADSYNWSINGITYPGKRTFDFGEQNFPEGVYAVKVNATLTINSQVCSVSDSVEITVNHIPSFSVSTSLKAHCGLEDGTIIITLHSLGDYSYSINGRTVGPIATMNSPLEVNIGGGETIIGLVNEVTSCAQFTNISVPNFPLETNITSTLTCDDGKPFTINVSPKGVSKDGLFQYSWFYNGIEQTQTGSSFLGVAEGEYTSKIFEEENIDNCNAISTITISRTPTTPTTLLSTPIFCPPEEPQITLDPGANFISYLWNDGSTSQTLDVSSGGTYTVMVTDTNGCTTTGQSEVLEDCVPSIKGANAFRPDGVNTTYSLFPEYVDKFEIFIYNRWGRLVYNSTNPKFAWDGSYNKKILPPGQYSWVVRYTSAYRDRGTLEAYGGVVLLR